MKKLFILLMVLLIVSGCSTAAMDNLQWFQTVDEAIEYGLQEENIKQQDLIGEITENGERFIFYKIKTEDGLGLGVANIIEKNGQFAWFRSDPHIIVNGSQVSWESEIPSKKRFIIYTGILENEDMSIETEKGMVKPYIDSTNKIFYYVESVDKTELPEL